MVCSCFSTFPVPDKSFGLGLSDSFLSNSPVPFDRCALLLNLCSPVRLVRASSVSSVLCLTLESLLSSLLLSLVFLLLFDCIALFSQLRHSFRLLSSLSLKNVLLVSIGSLFFYQVLLYVKHILWSFRVVCICFSACLVPVDLFEQLAAA